MTRSIFATSKLFIGFVVGDMLRAVIASGSPLGSKIKKVSVTLLMGVVCECTLGPAYNEYDYYGLSSFNQI